MHVRLRARPFAKVLTLAALCIPLILTPTQAQVSTRAEGDGIVASVAGLEVTIEKTGELSQVRVRGRTVVESVSLDLLDAGGAALTVSPDQCQPLDVADTFGGKSILASGWITQGGVNLRYEVEVRVFDDASVALLASFTPLAAFSARQLGLTALLPAGLYAGEEFWYNPRGERGGESVFRPGFSVNKTLPATGGQGEVISAFTWCQFPTGDFDLEVVTEQGNNRLEDRRGQGVDAFALANVAPYPYPRIASGDQRTLLMTIRPPAPEGFTLSPQAREARDAFEVAQALYGEGKHERALEKLTDFLGRFASYREAAVAQYYVADCHYHLQDYQSAADAYTTLIGRYPRSGVIRQARFRLGESLYRLARYEDARTAFDALVATETTGELAAAASYWAGESEFNLKRYDQAMAAYQASLAASDASKYAPYAHYSVGLCLVELGRAEEATARFRAVIDEYPNSEIAPECQFRLAQASAAGGDDAQATAAYRAFLDANPESPLRAGALYGVAWSSFKAGDYAAARQGFEALVRDFPESEYAAESRARIADCLFLQEDYPGARDAYRALADAGGEAAQDAAFWLARCDQELGNSAAALDGLRAYVARQPEGAFAAEAHGLVGDLLAEQDDLDGAQAAYEAALAAGPSEAVEKSARLGLAWVRYQREQTPEALAALQELAAEAGDTQTATAVGIQGAASQVAEGDYEGALATMATVDLAALPKDAAAQAETIRGRALAGVDRHEEALAAFDAALASGDTPARAAATAGKARSLVALSRLGEAEGLVDSLAGMGAAPEVEQRARYDLGDALLQAEQFEQAKRQFDAIAQGAETSITPYALFGLGVVAASTGDHQAAADALRQVLDRFAESPAAAPAKLQLGRSLAAMGNAEEAAELLAGAAAGDAAGAELLLELAHVAEQAGRADEARLHLTKLIETFPAHALAPEALFRLGEIAFDAEDYTTALAHYGRVADEFPQAEIAKLAHYKRGWCHRFADRFAEAAASFALASDNAAHPEVAADASYQRGGCLILAGDVRAGAQALLAFADANPQSDLVPAALLSAGDALRREGDTAGAQAAYRRVVDEHAASPDAPYARVGLAACEQAAGNHEAAVALLGNVRTDERSELEAQALCLRGISLLALERTDEALDTFERTAVLYSAFPEWAGRAQLGVGECEERLGRADDARKSYQRVVDDFGATQAAEAARARLTDLGG